MLQRERENMREKEKRGKKRESLEKYKILKTPFLAEITDKSLTFSNRAQSRILWS